ncbi:MAG: DUF4291 domain-containing protein [Cyanobacteria bacterium P01_E01_bin.42]
MPQAYEIRANYDRNTIVIYQAYSPAIADLALEQQKFVSPFSFNRMTWIKPSFLWLMHRTNWGQKDHSRKTLAIRIMREGWEKALSLGILTHPEPSIYPHPDEWEVLFQNSRVHIQWDTERSLRGMGLNYYSIQVGLSRHIIREYVDEWIVNIEDLSPKVTKIRQLLKLGKEKNAKSLLPSERVYPIDPQIGKRIAIAL